MRFLFLVDYNVNRFFSIGIIEINKIWTIDIWEGYFALKLYMKYNYAYFSLDREKSKYTYFVIIQLRQGGLGCQPYPSLEIGFMLGSVTIR